MKRAIFGVSGVAIAAVLGFLTLAPTRVDPVAWTAPPAPDMESGVYKSNAVLAGLQRIAAGKGALGPDSIAADAQGRIYAGLEDGRVVRLSDNAVDTLVNTGGRPLGLDWRGETLIIADGRKGLLAYDPKTKATKVLATEAGGVAFGFPDDVKVSADGRYAYLSDASIRWGYGQDGESIIEHKGDGRLVRYDFETGKTDVLMSGVNFANGVALGPDDAFIALAETANYRVLRYWLKGEKAGQTDVFADNLPGFPDNVTFNGKDRFWVSLYAPRNPMIDGLADKPYVRKMLLRAMQVLPKPVEKRAMVLALDLDGKSVALAQDAGKDNYSPITHALQVGDQLYVSSFLGDGVARIPVAAVLGK